MPEWLANPPWYIPVVLGLAACALLYQGNNLLNKKLKWTGLGLAVVAVLILLVSSALESGRERVIRHTRELADAVERRDWPSFRALLDPKVSFVWYKGADELTRGAEKSADQVGVKNITLSGMEIKDEPGGYVVDFMATADIDIGPRAPTNWRFYWAKNDDDSYSLYRIELLPNQQFGTDPVLSRLAK